MERRNFDQKGNVFGLEIVEVFLLNRDNNRKVLFKVNRFDKLAEVRQQVRAKLQIDGPRVHLLTKGRLLQGDHKTLKDFKVEGKQVL